MDTSGLVAFVSRLAAVRPLSTSAEGPAAQAPDVWLRDWDGEHQRRISPEVAGRLVSDGLADRVSAAGHIRLKLGIRWSLNSPSLKSTSTITTVDNVARVVRIRTTTPLVRIGPPGRKQAVTHRRRRPAARKASQIIRYSAWLVCARQPPLLSAYRKPS